MTDPKDTDPTAAPNPEKDAKEELFEALDHFKRAASLFFDRGSEATKAAGESAEKVLSGITPAVNSMAQSVSKEAEKVAEKIDPTVRSVADKVDPAVRSVAGEAERVITQIGSAAEPMAKQLTSELSKLTRKLTEGLEAMSDSSKRKSAPPIQTADEKKEDSAD